MKVKVTREVHGHTRKMSPKLSVSSLVSILKFNIFVNY